MDITGILKVIGNERIVTEKFKTREFVITDNSSQYPQHISFQLTQDKCDLIDNFSLSDTITVHFNCRGREWVSPKGEVKHFNTLEAWRIEGEEAGFKDNKAESKPVAKKVTTKASENQVADNIGPPDDLPF